MQIRKRDGNLQEFDFHKVYNAVNKAFLEIREESVKNDIVDSIHESIPNICKDGIVELEDLQDLIENVLMDYEYKDVAKGYILYRYNHQLKREAAIASKLRGSNIENQNANVDEASFGGRIGEAGRIVTKAYALDHCVSKMAKENHLNNMIYIHDLDSYAVGEHNCLTVPIDDLLKNGFTIKNSDIRPAGSISSALQLVAVVFQTQSLCQFGGVSVSHLDWSMIPYVRKSFYKHWKNGWKYLRPSEVRQEFWLNDENVMLSLSDSCLEDSITHPVYKADLEVYHYAMDMLKSEIHQGVEALYHNLNSLLSRSGDQLPFSSINYGTCTQIEGQMVTEEILKCSIEGIGKYHRTSIFPCGIFQYMKGVNDKPGTPNYYLKQLALESTAKRLYPNYVNVDWSVNAGYDRNDPRTYTSTMGK